MNETPLFIFDMDGVLLDSEKLYLEMNLKRFADLGCAVSEAEYNTFIGISATTMWSYLKEKFSLPHTVEQLKEFERELKYQTLSAAALTASVGLEAFLRYLKKEGCATAIASSSLPKNIELIIDKLHLRPYFNYIISGEEVANGKPAPDIFLKVAEVFGKSPADCVVVEDSTNGLKAALAAGMYSIGYRNPTSGNQDLTLADMVIDCFEDQRLIAGSWFKRSEVL